MRISMWITLVAITFIGGSVTGEDKAEGVKITSPKSFGCEEPESGTPEVYSYFGEGKKVLAKLEGVNVELPKRKIYVLMVEGPASAEALLYERSGKNKVTLSRWSGKSASDLREEIEKGILSNKGVHCIGEQTKAIVKRKAGEDLKSEKEVDTPVSVKAALSHSIQKLQDKFIRVTVILLC